MKQKISKSVLRQYPSLSELPDINITGLSDGQVLKQDNATSTQKPLTVSGGGNAFGTVVVSGQSDVVADSANDTLTLVAGSNITLTTNATSDTVTIAASASGNAFGTIAVSGQNNVVADSVNDTLTLVAWGLEGMHKIRPSLFVTATPAIKVLGDKLYQTFVNIEKNYN